MESQEGPPPTRARRRILSCSNCRRLKSRCEYDPRINACQRCHKLRIQCSLHSDRPPARVAAASYKDLRETTSEERISNVETSLALVKESVDRIWNFLQQSANLPHSFGASPLQGHEVVDSSSRSQSEQQLETTEFPPLHQAQTDVHKSAPIMVVRKFRPSTRRLYDDPKRDIINQGILREDIAEKSFAEFISRLGHVIQVKAIEDLTSSSSVRESSPLLYAVCCLQALRFVKRGDVVTANDHRRLYEEVRKMLGQVVLATPTPIEELYAMLIMCTFEAAPKPAFEYIESWHLSGICAQQAISTIDFTEIISNLSHGRHETRDKRYLSLWNNICLVNLRFAVGTGKPATIPSDLLEQCPAILNHPQATIDDGLILAEIMLFSTLCNKCTPPLLDRHGYCAELETWEKRWEHLLDSKKSIYLRFAREFAYIVLAMRLVERYRLGKTNLLALFEDSPMYEKEANADNDAIHFQACAHEHALAMASIFLEMSASSVQGLPKFHNICIGYCSIVISECAKDTKASRQAAFDTLSAVCSHYQQFSDELPAVMNVALEKITPGPSQDEQTYDPYHSAGRSGEQFTGMATESRLANSGLPGDTVETEEGITTEYFDNELGLLSFPTVDDFFGSWMMDAGNN